MAGLSDLMTTHRFCGILLQTGRKAGQMLYFRASPSSEMQPIETLLYTLIVLGTLAEIIFR
jgi:hypothetical protein